MMLELSLGVQSELQAPLDEADRLRGRQVERAQYEADVVRRRFMLVVLAGAAKKERNLTRERTKSAMAVKRANGQGVGTVPYGFDLGANGLALVPNEAEQAIIAEIKAMRSRGMKLKQIASELTARGVPTKTGKSSRWTHQAVARILTRTRG